MAGAFVAPFPDREQSPYPVPYTASYSDGAWRTLVFVLVGTLTAVGVCWLAYILFVRNCILLWKAKKHRKTEEFGFGNTPVRPPNNDGRQG